MLSLDPPLLKYQAAPDSIWCRCDRATSSPAPVLALSRFDHIILPHPPHCMMRSDKQERYAYAYDIRAHQCYVHMCFAVLQNVVHIYDIDLSRYLMS